MADRGLPIIYEFPGKSKSSVWQTFGFYMGEDGNLDKSHAICKICHHPLKYSGNTTNLHTHLGKHQRDGAQSSVTTKTLQSGALKIDHFIINETSFGSSGDENVVSSGQPIIRNFFSQANRSDTLNAMVAEFMIENLISPDVVETQSFINLMGLADPNFRVQRKEYFTDNLFSQLYDVYHLSLVDLIATVPSSTVTLESWKTIDGLHYMTYSAHLVTKEWTSQSYVLKSGPNPADLKTTLQDVCKSMNVNTDALVIVGDASILSMPESSIIIDCLGIVIHNTARHALTLKDVSKTVETAKVLALSIACPEAVPAESDTAHWLSVYDMMTAVVQQKCKLVAKDDSKIARDIEEIEIVIAALKPLQLAADHLKEQTDPFVSLVLPMLRKLEKSLKTGKTESSLLTQIQTEMWNHLRGYYQNSEVKDYLLVSSLLDPRFKELLFVDVADLKRARSSLATSANKVYEEMSNEKDDDISREHYFSNIALKQEGGTEPALKKIKTEVIEIKPMTTPSTSGDDGDWLSDVVCKKAIAAKEETRETVQAEIERYFAIEQTTSPPLAWWQSRETIYPILARVARKYLCSPATSLPPDLMFKKCAGEVNRRRSALPPDLVDKMLFLNKNHAKLKE